MREFYLLYVKTLWHHEMTARKLSKDLLLGFCVLFFVIALFLISRPVGNLAVITYFGVGSLVGFFPNETFWNVEDYSVLNIGKTSNMFYVLSLMQRILLDSFVMLAIMVGGVSVFLGIKYGLVQLVVFLIYVCLGYIIYPFSSLIVEKRNIIVNLLCIISLLMSIGYAWLDFLFWNNNSFIYEPANLEHVLLILAIAFGLTLVFLFLGRFTRSPREEMYLSRIIYKPLKKVDIWLFKESVQFSGMIITTVFSILVSLIIVCDSEDTFGLLRMIVCWVLITYLPLSSKDKNRNIPKIISGDPLFCLQSLSSDILFIRKKKFKLIFFGSFLRLFVLLPCIAIAGLLTLDNVAVFVFTILICSLLECYILFRSSLWSKIIVYCVKLTIPVTWGIVALQEWSIIVLFSYMAFVFMVSLLLLSRFVREVPQKMFTIV